MERAEEEVDYEVESGMISMQIMRTPDDSLIVTFSDQGAEEGIQAMMNQLQSLAGSLEENQQSDSDAFFQELGASLEKEPKQSENEKENQTNKATDQEYLEHMKDVEKKRLEKIRQNQIASKVYCFSGLEVLENFTASLQLEKNIPSKLYKDNKTGQWYLLIKKGKLKLEEYQSLCQHLQEYAVLCSQQPFVEQYCKEHYDCIIGKQALKTIKNYIG